MLAGVIFDFDGVIVDSHPVHMQAWKTLFRSMGKAVGDEELSFVMEGAKREEILRRFLGDLTPEQIKLYGAEKEGLYQARASELKLVCGVTEFLGQVEEAGVPIAVATSGSRNRVERTLDAFGLLKRFHTIVTAEDVARGKPDPALFHLAARRLQVDADQILVCEDAVAGVMAGGTGLLRSLGFHGMTGNVIAASTGSAAIRNRIRRDISTSMRRSLSRIRA